MSRRTNDLPLVTIPSVATTTPPSVFTLHTPTASATTATPAAAASSATSARVILPPITPSPTAATYATITSPPRLGEVGSVGRGIGDCVSVIPYEIDPVEVDVNIFPFLNELPDAAYNEVFYPITEPFKSYDDEQVNVDKIGGIRPCYNGNWPRFSDLTNPVVFSDDPLNLPASFAFQLTLPDTCKTVQLFVADADWVKQPSAMVRHVDYSNPCTHGRDQWIENFPDIYDLDSRSSEYITNHLYKTNEPWRRMGYEGLAPNLNTYYPYAPLRVTGWYRHKELKDGKELYNLYRKGTFRDIMHFQAKMENAAHTRHSMYGVPSHDFSTFGSPVRQSLEEQFRIAVDNYNHNLGLYHSRLGLKYKGTQAFPGIDDPGYSLQLAEGNYPPFKHSLYINPETLDIYNRW